MSFTISKNNIDLLTNFCLTLDTVYLLTLDTSVKDLFIKYSNSKFEQARSNRGAKSRE